MHQKLEQSQKALREKVQKSKAHRGQDKKPGWIHPDTLQVAVQHMIGEYLAAPAADRDGAIEEVAGQLPAIIELLTD